MFKLIKLIIFLVGLVVVSGFVLSYFGYEINYNYLTESKQECDEKIDQCRRNVINKGIDSDECKLDCLNKKFILKK